MIEFFYECDFSITALENYTDWVTRIITSEDSVVGNINFIFCEDHYLLKINQEYLKHDTYTDIITFDYSEDGLIHGDIFISVERVKHNAAAYNTSFNEELLRVMAHGLLHLLGYNDKSERDIMGMREKEEEKIKMFHVEQK